MRAPSCQLCVFSLGSVSWQETGTQGPPAGLSGLWLSLGPPQGHLRLQPPPGTTGRAKEAHASGQPEPDRQRARSPPHHPRCLGGTCPSAGTCGDSVHSPHPHGRAAASQDQLVNASRGCVPEPAQPCADQVENVRGPEGTGLAHPGPGMPGLPRGLQALGAAGLMPPAGPLHGHL